MNLIRNSAIALITITGLSGCASVDTDYDPNYNFSNIKTFALIPSEALTSTDPRVSSTLINSRISDALKKQLEQKGYVYSADNADIKVTYHISISKGFDAETYNVGLGYNSYRWGVGYNTTTRVHEYDNADFMIDLVKPDNKTLVWRASDSARIFENRTPEKRQKVIEKSIAKMLSAIPQEK